MWIPEGHGLLPMSTFIERLPEEEVGFELGSTERVRLTVRDGNWGRALIIAKVLASIY